MCASTPTWLCGKMASACCPYIEQYADCSATRARQEGVGFDERSRKQFSRLDSKRGARRMDRGTVGSASRGRLHVEIRHHGASAVVTVTGELDHHTADLLRESLEGCVDDGYARLVVDCSRLEFMDSTGLNVLLGARLRAEAEGAGSTLPECSPWWPGFSRSPARRRFSRCMTRSIPPCPTDVTRSARNDAFRARSTRHNFRAQEVGVLTVRSGRRHLNPLQPVSYLFSVNRRIGEVKR